VSYPSKEPNFGRIFNKFHFKTVLWVIAFSIFILIIILYSIALGYPHQILSGFIITMWLYGLALLMGFIVGLFFAILRQYGGWFISRFATGYIEIIRGTPLLAQILLFFFLPFSIMALLGLSFTPTWSFYITIKIFNQNIIIVLLNYRTLIGILTLGINSSAYQAEYFRGAIMSVGSGQLMAAQSLGMSRLAGIRHVVLPQALRRVIPAWSNEAAYLPKYTVIVYFIGVSELFAKAHYIVSKNFLTLATYILVALIFLVMITIISRILDFVHKKTGIPGL